MIKRISYKESLELDNTQFIDVRSPKEFNEDTIIGSINIPILNNKERELVGHNYHNVSKEKSKEIGLEIVSNKLSYFYKEIKRIVRLNKKPILFCYRGGMRSTSIAKILDIMDLPIYILDGGYKEYRHYIINNINKFNNYYNFIVLHGYTGVGKTKILKILKNKGFSILDLEGLAQNSGSVFGNIFYKNPSNNQKRFESLLYNDLDNMKNKYVFVESESKRIGKSIIPNFLYENIQDGFHINIDTTINNRIENIIDDYLVNKDSNNDEKIIESIENLKKRLGNETIKKLIKEFKHDNYEYVIKELMVNYYDPLYRYSIKKIDNYDFNIFYGTIDDAIKGLIEFYNRL